MNKKSRIKQFVLLALCMLMSVSSFAERLKDIANLAGVRSNPLVGYGLVVGLDGTGDQTTQTPFTTQSFNSMLKQFGVTLPAGTSLQLKNVAAVALHASLPPFSKPGHTIDVTISSIGNSKSLRGGSLLMAPLKGADGKIYAVAQGNLVVGGFGAEGSDGSSITVNVPSVGRIPNGAIVERAVPTAFTEGTGLVFNLQRADFTTAMRVSDKINDILGPNVAQALDAGSIRVTAPEAMNERVAYMAMLENLDIAPGAAAAKVIINSRTGTIVVGSNVRVSPVAVSHGSLTVTISEDPGISQPEPFSEGQTAEVADTTIEIDEEANKMFKFQAGSSLDDIVRAVNQVGAAPGDLMAILEAMKQAGALQAELKVI